MVHHHQRVVIDIVGLPQLARNAKVVIAVARFQVLAGNLEPFLRLVNACDDLRVDVQP